VKKQIETIIARIDPECVKQIQEDFDKNVNAALKDGWMLVTAGVTDLYFWAIVVGRPI